MRPSFKNIFMAIERLGYLSCPEKLVYLMIHEHSRDHGACRLSNADLAGLTSLSGSTVSRALGNLERLILIKRFRYQEDCRQGPLYDERRILIRKLDMYGEPIIEGEDGRARLHAVR